MNNVTGHGQEKNWIINYDVLEDARLTWESLSNFRQRRGRSRDYYRGKPKETVYDRTLKKEVFEDDYIQSQGRIPYKSNQIGPMMRNLKGQMRAFKTQRIAVARNRDGTAEGEMMSEAITEVNDFNRTDDVIDVDAMEENLVGGLYGWKIGYTWQGKLNRYEVAIDLIDPTRMFFNQNIQDRRLVNLKIIGEVHDISLDEIKSQFGETKEERDFIESQYREYARQPHLLPTVTGFSYKDQTNFYLSVDPNLCRLIEVWRKEYRNQNFVHDPNTGLYDVLDVTPQQIAQLNWERANEAIAAGSPEPLPIQIVEKFAPIWRVYFLTPNGLVLHEQDTPYWHQEHPYEIGFASLFDGEIWGLVEDIIDQQRLVNRLITNIDHMFGASMKGIIFVPEDSIPEGISFEQFAEEVVKFNGIIKIKHKPGSQIPQQVTANAIPAAMFTWLGEVQRQFQDISGVQNAQYGQAPQSGTPSSLYQAQIAQSQLNNRDYFDGFYATRRQRDLKAIQLISQYYDEPRWLVVNGRRADGQKRILYNPAKVRDIQWSLVVSDAPDSPNLRMLSEEFLQNLLQQNRLTFRQFLQVSSNPKADTLLQLIDKTDQLMQQMTPEQRQQLLLAAQSGDPDAMAMMSQTQ